MAPSERSKDRIKILWENINRSHGKIYKSTAYISRVPQEIRKQNKSAYTPRLVSIGPLHIQSMDNHLQSHMENIKGYYVYELLKHVAEQLKEVDTQQLAEKLKGFEDLEAREMAKKLQDGDAKEELLSRCMKQMEFCIEKEACKNYYPEEAHKAVNAEMLVTDGCFIIWFLKHFEKKEEDTQKKKCGAAFSWVSKCGDICDKSSSNKEENMDGGASSSSLGGPLEPIVNYPMRLVSVLRDLLLLENQLPFFVLDNLFSLTLGLLPHDKQIPLERYILDCFCQTLGIGHSCIKPDATVPDQQNQQQAEEADAGIG